MDELNRYLRLRTIPIGRKRFETVEEMEAIPRFRRPKGRLATDQGVTRARLLGWTVGVTKDDLIGAQCGAVVGLHPRSEDWLSGKRKHGRVGRHVGGQRRPPGRHGLRAPRQIRRPWPSRPSFQGGWARRISV